MNDDYIILSDDSNDANFFQKTKSDEDDDFSILKEKADSDLSESEFPIVRFSEINYKPNLQKNLRDEEVNNLNFSDLNCDNKNDSLKRNSQDRVESLTFEIISKKVSSQNKIARRKSQNFSEDSYDIIQNLVTDSLQEKEWSNFELQEVNSKNNNYLTKNSNDRNKYDSDSDYESQYISKKSFSKNEANVVLSDDSNEFDNGEKIAKKINRKRKYKGQQAGTADNDKDNCSKLTKKCVPKAASKTNPKESMKIMEVILDNEIRRFDFFGDFCKISKENEFKWNVTSQLIPKSITWKRKVEADDKQELNCNSNIDENHLMIIWDCKEVVKHVSEETFVSTISNVNSLISNKTITLVIYKIQSYFKYLKSIKGKKNSDNDKQNKNKTKTGKGFSNYPRISKKRFDEYLVEIQLLCGTNSRLIENPEDMVLLIQQYTKSLATLPSKIEKDEKISEIDWCISVDNKDSVKVDKEGNGLFRLWQQQLCQFAQTSLETSEAITTVYKSPLQLIEAYTKCTQAEGQLLLKDIPIRRSAGIITSSKRIGPELSKKLYVMFTSTDGDIYLNES